MRLWEFALGFEDAEAAAAASAATAIAGQPAVVLLRPGRPAAPDVERRWREVSDMFPMVFADAGRLARYARGQASL